jgi:hypothetical protein
MAHLNHDNESSTKSMISAGLLCQQEALGIDFHTSITEMKGGGCKLSALSSWLAA